MISQQSFKLPTNGRGMINITSTIATVVAESKINAGICNVFIHHTSASLIVCENADPAVQHDLEVFMGHLIPDGDRLFSHVAEGPDDMPAHIRTILTLTSLTIPVLDNQLDLGTWQGIYLWEHRLQNHERKITISILGE